MQGRGTFMGSNQTLKFTPFAMVASGSGAERDKELLLPFGPVGSCVCVVRVTCLAVQLLGFCEVKIYFDTLFRRNKAAANHRLAVAKIGVTCCPLVQIELAAANVGVRAFLL